MKKFLILFVLLLTSVFASIISINSTAFGICPINSENSVCSLPEPKTNTPIFQNLNSERNMNNVPNILQPKQREDIINNINPSDNTMNYNSSCQFGSCLQDLNARPAKQ